MYMRERRRKKPWYKSKTIWFNALCAMLVAVEAVFSVFQGVIPGNTFATLTVLMAAGNAFLRVISTGGIGGRA